MKKTLPILVATLVAVIPSTRAADVTGAITFKGVQPKEVVMKDMEDNADCIALHKEGTPATHFYVVGKNGELDDVLVSLKDASGKVITGKSSGANAPGAVLDQKGCIYTPSILAIQTGQKLIVKNSDPCVHNVHSTPAVDGNEGHNDAQFIGGPDLTYTFAKPEMFLKFQCDIHPWMFAWVSVFDHPYFAVSGADGKFTIKNVPPGKYVVEAAHRKLGTQSQPIEISDKGAVANFTFEPK